MKSHTMPGTCVIGLQWGDEAKGKIVDRLTREHDFVVRYQGGANAGHTVVVGDQVYKLSLLPSGILTPGVTCVIAGGVVINPARVIEELDELAKRGAGACRQSADQRPGARDLPLALCRGPALDKNTSDGENIGTTGRGIGPCYRDKVGRSHAVRLGDLYRPDVSRAGRAHRRGQEPRARSALSGRRISSRSMRRLSIREYSAYAERLRPYVCDTTELLLTAAESGKRILFEGAQGALLDVDHGTYPFVTSSNSSGVGIASGSGVPVRYIDHIIGVVKAYSTRVGGGPFPTEQDNATGQYLRDRGNEYGTVTRRPRRCGWLDVVALRYTSRLSGVDSIAVMLLDVLSGLDELKICTAYEIDGKADRRDSPATSTTSAARSPCTKRCPAGRKKSPAAARYDELPANARAYLRRISELVGQPIENGVRRPRTRPDDCR